MRRPNHLLFVTVTIMSCVLGCGVSESGSYGPAAGVLDRAMESEASSDSEGELNLTLADRSRSMESGVPTTTATESKLKRKIIYQVTLDLVVEDIAKLAGRVEELALQHDGFISQSSIDTAPGRPRSGTWTIRVPVAHYDAFLNAAGSLGELERQTKDSREVTAEYYDLETRIRNKKAEEERLLEHLADSTGKLEDILAVEKELSRVRTEVEQMQGQLRVLQDLTALSTVTLNAREIQGYVPEASPTFGTLIRRAWQQSIDGLTTAGKLVVIAAVAFVPWLIVLGVPLAVTILLRRRWRRRRQPPQHRP